MNCRVCGGADFRSVVNLGTQPLANRFLHAGHLDQPEPSFPLHLLRCVGCGLCQLDTVVDRELLYRDYVYQSGYSEGWQRHCGALAVELEKRYPGGSVLDVAANDGTLLRACRNRGLRVLGVEPARNLDLSDVPVIREFWPTDVPRLYDAIVAQNVFGHVDDCRGFLAGIAGALQEDGVAIIECPWVVDLIRHCRWDTIYHEHLSYWGLQPLNYLAKGEGLQIEKVEYFPHLHGGSLRYYLTHGPEDLFCPESVARIFDEETLLGEDAYLEFGLRASIQRNTWTMYFANQQGRAIAAYGASAKFNTLLNSLPERPGLVGIFDDNPIKWNLYTPGWHIPVLRPTPDVMAGVEELVVGAPNWIDVITPKARLLGLQGEVKSLWA